MTKAKSIFEDPEKAVKCLSPQELDLLRLLGQGVLKGTIARQLGISVQRVDALLTSTMAKLQIEDGLSLVRFAAQWVIWHYAAEKDSDCPSPSV